MNSIKTSVVIDADGPDFIVMHTGTFRDPDAMLA